MYSIDRLLKLIETAVEIEQWTTYERIAKEAEISIIALWKIRHEKTSPTLKTANKIASALEKIKKVVDRGV